MHLADAPGDLQTGIAEADHHADAAQVHERAPEVGFSFAGTDREVAVTVHGAVVIEGESAVGLLNVEDQGQTFAGPVADVIAAVVCVECCGIEDEGKIEIVTGEAGVPAVKSVVPAGGEAGVDDPFGVGQGEATGAYRRAFGMPAKK